MSQSEQSNGLVQGWHLRKEVNITHILTTIALVGSILSFGHSMDNRIIKLETQYESQQAINVKMEKHLERINNKLDRLIERV